MRTVLACVGVAVFLASAAPAAQAECVYYEEPCRLNSDCPAGYRCEDGACCEVPPPPEGTCYEDIHCPFGGVYMYCDTSTQTCDHIECHEDRDCGLGEVCEHYRCQIDVGADGDRDGIPDQADNCPAEVNAGQDDLDQDGVGDVCNDDDDGDGAVDDADNCPHRSNPQQRDADGDGRGDRCSHDSDLDGLIDGLDNCPGDFNPAQADTDGDGRGDACDPDDDNDGVADGDDLCPKLRATNWHTGEVYDQEDWDDDGIGDACDDDMDGDLVPNHLDSCPRSWDPYQTDEDGDGAGDVCDAEDGDRDDDAVDNPADNCPDVANASQQDEDGDGIGDACDRCPAVAYPDNQDLDGDGLGDGCDVDDDGDCHPDVADNCPLTANNMQSDTDGDGIGDSCDQDPGSARPDGYELTCVLFGPGGGGRNLTPFHGNNPGTPAPQQSDGDCCSPHKSGGCAPSECSSLVCEVKPSCCQGQWTAQCVALAEGPFIEACGCYQEHDGPVVDPTP